MMASYRMLKPMFNFLEEEGRRLQHCLLQEQLLQMVTGLVQGKKGRGQNRAG